MQIGADTHGRLVKRLSVKSFDPIISSNFWTVHYCD